MANGTLVTGVLTCLHCGHLMGEWAGRAGGPFLAGGLRNGSRLSSGAGTPLRCGRCQGPLFLDGATAVLTSARLDRIARLRRQLEAAEARAAARKRRRRAA